MYVNVQGRDPRGATIASSSLVPGRVRWEGGDGSTSPLKSSHWSPQRIVRHPLALRNAFARLSF